MNNRFCLSKQATSQDKLTFNSRVCTIVLWLTSSQLFTLSVNSPSGGDSNLKTGVETRSDFPIILESSPAHRCCDPPPCHAESPNGQQSCSEGACRCAVDEQRTLAANRSDTMLLPPDLCGGGSGRSPRRGGRCLLRDPYLIRLTRQGRCLKRRKSRNRNVIPHTSSCLADAA